MNRWRHQSRTDLCQAIRNTWVWAAVILAGMFAITNAAHGLTTVPRSFEELVALADQIVVGTVESRESRWRDPVQQRGIVTQITLTDLEWLKAARSGEKFSLQVAGGQIGPYGEAIGGLPQLFIGERYVLFVRGNTQSLFPVVGIEQGVLKVRNDERGLARVYTFTGIPLTQLDQIETPARALSGAPALSLESLRQAVNRVLEEQSVAAP